MTTDWSNWTIAERYVAGLLRESGCDDPQPLLGFRPYASESTSGS